jgi:arsenate reductase (thioredoxin)
VPAGPGDAGAPQAHGAPHLSPGTRLPSPLRQPFLPNSMKPVVRNVLFLCTGNSARSILAEALLGTLGAARFEAFSAGSQPTGRVQPIAAELATLLGYPSGRLRSKSWDEFAAPGAPEMDIVITVCGNAAADACPAWLGTPVVAHWGVADPAAVEGDEPTRRAAYEAALAALRQRVEALLALPLDELDAPVLQARLREIGGSAA